MSDRGEPRHDTSIGAAITTLAVPEHGPRFWHELGGRLLAERDAPAAPPFDPLARLEGLERRTDARTGEPGAHTGRVGRSAARQPEDEARSPRPTVTKLAEQADLARGRRNWGRWAVWAMVIGAGAALALVAVWVGATADPKASKLDAARVAGRMSANVNSSDYLLGQVVTTAGDGTVESYAFVRAADGSFRYRGLNVRSDTAFDSARGSARTWRERQVGQAGPTVEGFEDVGLATGPPDPDGSGRYMAGDALTRITRALEASGTATPRLTKYEGREVWEFDVADRSQSAAPGRLRVMVDQERLEPLLAVRSAGGRVTERARFARLRTTSSVRPDTFDLVFPAGTSVQSFDNGFARVELPQVAAATGYDPITPAWLPAGFELAEVAMQPGSRPDLLGTAAGDNPPNTDVVSLLYRRGLEHITVSTRRTGGRDAVWVDPFRPTAASHDRAATPRRTRLEGGRFLGSTAEQVTTGTSVAHVWGRNDDYVFTVAGDLTPSELLGVAESLT